MIHYSSDSVSFHIHSKRLLSSWITKVLMEHNYKVGEINYVFTSDEKLLEINKQFLKHDYYTDIITFDTSSYLDLVSPSSSNPFISGDIFISIDTIKYNSGLFHTSFNDELHRVMIHGILHLIGFDDQTEEQQKEMTAKENYSLSLLSYED